MAGFHHDDDVYEGDGVPLTAVTRAIVVIVHYAAIPCVSFAIYAFLRNIHVLEQRIWSPMMLLTALTWLLLATAFEISNHFYVDNWQLYDPQSDIINGSFSFFNFGAQNLMAVSLRKRDLAFARKGTSLTDWLMVFFDPLLLLLIVINPIVYGFAGRSTAVTALSPVASVAGLTTLFRLWKNLGPNVYTLIGGISFMVLVMLGVGMLAVYRATEVEWIHVLIGGPFVASTLPLALAFWNATPVDDKSESDEVHGPGQVSPPLRGEEEA